MPRTRTELLIDARPRGASGPLARERILDRPVLAWLVEHAAALGEPRVTIHARLDEFDDLRGLIPEALRPSCFFSTGPPAEGGFILRADRLYDPSSLRRSLRSGRDPENAVIWRLDGPSSLAAAGDELIRRQTYQPFGRYWARGPARWLARLLCPTRIRPNHVTMLAFGLILSAAGCVAWGGPGLAWRLASATALALALVLDTSDGHLARLQGTASDFGRWLDGYLDEVGDLALHGAIAWSLAEGGTRPAWLLVGIAYASGKYLLAFGSMSWDAACSTSTPQPEASAIEDSKPGTRLRSLVLGLGHADRRWHLWIVLAALGRLDLELALYTAYYPLRALGGAWRKARTRG